MTIFVVFAVQEPTKVGPAIAREFANDHLALNNNEWLISANSTAQDVATKLGIPGGTVGSAIVFSMANYYGRSSTSTWDWIKVKLERSGG